MRSVDWPIRAEVAALYDGVILRRSRGLGNIMRIRLLHTCLDTRQRLSDRITSTFFLLRVLNEFAYFVQVLRLRIHKLQNHFEC